MNFTLFTLDEVGSMRTSNADNNEESYKELMIKVNE